MKYKWYLLHCTYMQCTVYLTSFCNICEWKCGKIASTTYITSLLDYEMPLKIVFIKMFHAVLLFNYYVRAIFLMWYVYLFKWLLFIEPCQNSKHYYAIVNTFVTFYCTVYSNCVHNYVYIFARAYLRRGRGFKPPQIFRFFFWKVKEKIG